MVRKIVVNRTIKKNLNVLDKFERFLPTNFTDILKKIRRDEKERLKRIGII